ncbi:MAG: glycosyltransferase family 2 protein [Mycobacteriales bacterium]
MRVAVVVPSWNGVDLLPACLDSLIAQDPLPEIVVVDNGSTDGSPELVERDYPNVVLLKQRTNLGFAGGVNIGIHHALAYDAQYIALFNNDAVAQPGWLEALVDEAEHHPEAGIVTGRLVSGDGSTIDSTGDFYSWWGYPFPRGRGEPNDPGRYADREEVFGASGGATLYRAQMLRGIGLFDEAFFAYYEDVDLSFRAQLAGWRVRYTPAAVAFHEQGSTSGRISGFHRFHSLKNFVFLYMKNMPGRLWLRHLPRFLAGFAMLCAGTLRMGLPGALARALVQVGRSGPHLLRERKRVQALRTVPLRRIDDLLYKDMPPGQVRFFAVLQAARVRR